MTIRAARAEPLRVASAAANSERTEARSVAAVASEVVTVAGLETEIRDITTDPLRQSILDAGANATKAELEAWDAEAEAMTSDGETLTLILALSYGSRDEILRAAKQIARQVIEGDIEVDQLDNKTFSQFLDTGDLPEPDLMIRTSGEVRLSNFLLWQAAYAELYFTDVLWPDFDASELQKALDDYGCRKRRFGLTDEQLNGEEEQSH